MSAIDHTSLSVSDLAAAKAFYAAALSPLGISVQMEFSKEVTGSVDVAGLGVAGKPFFWLAGAGKTTPALHIAFSAKTAPRWMRSTRRPSLPALVTMGRLASARTTTPTTTARSSSTSTASISKRRATSPLERIYS